MTIANQISEMFEATSDQTSIFKDAKALKAGTLKINTFIDQLLKSFNVKDKDKIADIKDYVHISSDEFKAWGDKEIKAFADKLVKMV